MAAHQPLFGRRTAVKSGLALSAALLEGCSSESPQGFASNAGAGNGGGAGFGGTPDSQAGAAGDGTSGSGVGASAGSGGATAIPEPVSSGLNAVSLSPPPAESLCISAPETPLCDAVVWNGAPAQRVLYSWTTAEQLAELRSSRVLFSRSERPGMGRGHAFDALDTLASYGAAPENQLLSRLAGELFEKARFAWPHPWATRMGFPGEEYGDRLIEITLKPEARTVVVYDGWGMAVIDANNQRVDAALALAEIESIGAIFFVRTEVSGSGSFNACSGGYREFIVGNEAMIERWAVETPEMRARLEADSAALEAFLARVREDSTIVDAVSFPARVACEWERAPSTPLEVYLRSLALASERYLPRPAELAALVDTLRAGLFEPNPFIVTPGG